MIDARWLREDFPHAQAALRTRGDASSLERARELDLAWRQAVHEAETVQAERNRLSQQAGAARKEKRDASGIIAESQEVGRRADAAAEKAAQLASRRDEEMLRIPNLAHESVPVGPDDAANREERRRGEPPRLGFEPKPHHELGPALGILDLDRAAKLSGARFSVLRGKGATLHRALAQFMMAQAGEGGYTEIVPPYLVLPGALTGAGQLPKFASDLFRVEGRELYLIPTAEVPLTALHGGEILAEDDLPLRYAAWTPCFRSEAGSYGKDTKGMLRQHQFDKVELVELVRPEESFEALERMTRQAERVLSTLGLPYRVVTLSTGDMGFSAAKTYDIEVWLPGQARYREISSCSNCTDFQARRAGIRFRRGAAGKVEFVHTLNGSALAVGRAWIAVVENGQQADGSIRVPEALRPHTGFETIP